MKLSRLLLTIALLTVFLVAAAPSFGFAPGGMMPESIKIQNIVSTNPIIDMFGWFNLEFEHRIAPNSAIGVSGSFFSFDDGDDKYGGGDAFYRFYPQNLAPAGFFFGGRVGVQGVTSKREFEPDESATLFGVGFDIGYTFLIGEAQRFSLSLGVGAVRLFGEDLEDVPLTLPTIRLVNVGAAF